MPRRIRPPSDTDANAVLDVILARDVADLGAPDFTLEDLEADWSRPGLALEHDARVAVGAAGGIAGYAILLGDDAVVCVHPKAEGEGIGTVLRRWAEARAAERGTAVLRQLAYGSNDGARRHLREAGYEPAQHYFRLRADLDDVPPPPDVPLRTFEPADEEPVYRLIQDAFAEIEGNQEDTLEQWRAKGLTKAGHDPALWLLLDDDEGVAGAALGERWEHATGYVGELAVAKRARGRGYGRALLLGLLAAFRRAGLRHAELSVHGRNRGALALYQSAGMRSVWEAERWEKALGRA
jgi:mycothiol synthase